MGSIPQWTRIGVNVLISRDGAKNVPVDVYAVLDSTSDADLHILLAFCKHGTTIPFDGQLINLADFTYNTVVNGIQLVGALDQECESIKQTLGMIPSFSNNTTFVFGRGHQPAGIACLDHLDRLVLKESNLSEETKQKRLQEEATHFRGVLLGYLEGDLEKCDNIFEAIDRNRSPPAAQALVTDADAESPLSDYHPE